jgi:PiT family inorganic phosphate transporter
VLRPGGLLLMAWAAVALAVALAFWNGANDNGKGVASLLAYGAATPRQALAWAAATTALGAGLSALWGRELLGAFRAGFVDGGEGLSPAFFVAVLAAAGGWILVATFLGMPVSTTHAIVGALVGAGLVAVGAGRIDWTGLVLRFALPLALGPLAALVVVALAARPIGRLTRRFEARCACIVEPAVIADAGTGAAAAAVFPALAVGTVESCGERAPRVAVEGTRALEGVHWTTSGLVGFARGWNDAPKIAALALVAFPGGSGVPLAVGLVTVAMTAGGLLAGRRVLATLGQRVTRLPLGESLAASAASSLLVSLASFRGLPVSTTHVTTGAIVGAGVVHDPRGVHWRVVRDIVLAWIVTLPAAALFALGFQTVLP